MADRLLVFSDPDMIRFIRTNFIPVADNDWYSRRREDAVGAFFRKVADQGPRKGEGGSTRQGHYVLTSDGQLLGFNNNRALERRRAMMDQALAEFKALPAERRMPGKAAVPTADADSLDAKFVRVPPKDGVVLEAFTRALVRGEDGEMSAWKGTEKNQPGTQSARDHVWIKASEWSELIAAGDADGEVPPRLAHRLLRFHLVDNTRGEPAMWKLGDITDYQLKIEKTTEGKYQIAGSANLKSGSERGYDVALSGIIEIDEKTRQPVRFDLLAMGDHWGDAQYTRGARAGKTSMGVAFQLAGNDSPGINVPPQASSWEQGYYEAEKH